MIANGVFRCLVGVDEESFPSSACSFIFAFSGDRRKQELWCNTHGFTWWIQTPRIMSVEGKQAGGGQWGKLKWWLVAGALILGMRTRPKRYDLDQMLGWPEKLQVPAIYRFGQLLDGFNYDYAAGGLLAIPNDVLGR